MVQPFFDRGREGVLQYWIQFAGKLEIVCSILCRQVTFPLRRGAPHKFCCDVFIMIDPCRPSLSNLR